MFKFLFLITIIFQSVLFSQEVKNIAITIDDLPTLSHNKLTEEEQTDYFNRILEVLNKYNVPAKGFVAGNLIKDFNSHLIENFIQNGNSIGNHSYFHPDINKVSASEFIADIIRNETILSEFTDNFRFFRYPLLHTGNTQEKKDSVESFLLKNKYISAPVTIDNDDYEYNIRYVNAYKNNDTLLMKQIGEDYIEHMVNRTLYYDSLSQKMFNRPINQILLIHSNFINSFYLEKLITWYKADNRNFITLEEALKDPVYKLKDNYTGNKGLGWLERVEYQK
jgi:peptidoglycan/xylan/chitin deacetylase (PgdA/CDA1 family)